MYIWQLSNWPAFTWSYEVLNVPLSTVQRKQGRLIGQVEGLGFMRVQHAALEALTLDVVESSAIEGELLDAQQVRSSIARKVGLVHGAVDKADRAIDGVVDMTLDATRRAREQLTVPRLWKWHADLFPDGRSGWRQIRTGGWRDDAEGAMVVASPAKSPRGSERIHFEAPPANRLDKDVALFLDWFEQGPQIDWILKSAVAHLWFVTIHPFDDGNGRIARAIADMALARSDRHSQRFYSMSAQIHKQKNGYYAILERTQKGSLDITPWIDWFLQCLSAALDEAQKSIDVVLQKQLFWLSLQSIDLNERQRKVLNKLIEESKDSLKSSDYGRIAKCSQDTAHRDLLGLIDLGIVEKDTAGGRNTRYIFARKY